MIDGIVTDRDIPQITMSIGGREFRAVVEADSTDTSNFPAL